MRQKCLSIKGLLKRNVLEMYVHKGPLKNWPLKCVNLEMCQKCGHFSEMCLICIRDVMKMHGIFGCLPRYP